MLGIGLALSLTIGIASTSVMDAPDPRANGHAVADETGTLTASDIAAIDAVAKEAAAGGELVVIVINSTDGANPRQWATAYFNRLRVDHTGRNRGVVLMAALKDRKAEIVVGDGYDGGFQSITDSIMQGVVVAHFKRGDPRGAMVEGARALTTRLIASAPPPPPPLPVSPADDVPVAPDVPAEVIRASQDQAMQSIPDPRKSKGAVDLAKVLKAADQGEVANARAAVVASQSELFVVTVRNTGEYDTSTFARGLFHRLQPDPANHKGVLMVVVVPPTVKGKPAPQPPASLEILTGYAYPSAFAAPARTAVNDQFIAWLQRDPKAIGSAIGSAARTLSELDAALAAWRAQKQLEDMEEKRRREDEWAARLAATQAAEHDQGSRSRSDSFDRPFFDDDNPLAWGVLGAGLLGGGLGVREIIRRRPRSCPKCKVRMHRLAEEIDDKHLSAGEKTEERIGSVDYDIWNCEQCGYILKTRWGAIFSGYSTCKRCAWRTMSSTSRTIKSATQYSTGLAEVTERCSHCPYVNTYTRVIPRRPPPSRSSSGGGRSSSGGSSSGRGSSGSW